MDAQEKSVWESKTWWVNMIFMSLYEVVPNAEAWASKHPQTMLLACVVMNLVLRHFSDTKLTYGIGKPQ